MILGAVRGVASERLNEVLLLLNHISSLEPAVGEQVPQEIKIMKGLFFVTLYGALEKTTFDSLYILLLKIKELEPKNSDVIHPFNVVSMARRWKGIKDSGYKGVLPQMSGFFASISSNDYMGIDESLFSGVLQNIWAKTIDEIMNSLGVFDFSFTVSERAIIDELVDKRNAVAHGRESASTIGERYRSDELRRRLQDVQAFTVKLMDRLEEFYLQREFLIAGQRQNYQ